jgi:5-methylcytosine-specific restriction endonuclease McrA
MENVLLLNASYEPIRIIDFRRAIVMLLQEKVESVIDSEHAIRSPSVEIILPSVAKMKYYVHLPFNGLSSTPTKKGILRRDGGKCGYCNSKANTVDHIIPRSRNGKHTWDNLVACCLQCNQDKADKFLDEIGWKLLRKPDVPHSRPDMCTYSARHEWVPFLV